MRQAEDGGVEPGEGVHEELEGAHGYGDELTIDSMTTGELIQIQMLLVMDPNPRHTLLCRNINIT